MKPSCLLVVLAACGARLAEGYYPPDASGAGSPADQATDAATDGATALTDNACGVAADQGDIGLVPSRGEVEIDANGLRRYSFAGLIPATEAQPPPDAIYIQLFDGYGAFAGGAARAGEYMVAGDELTYATCGICVFTLANVDSTNGPTRVLLATGGTVKVLAVDPTEGAEFAIEVESATFQEVSRETFEPVAGSMCSSPLSHGRLEGRIDEVSYPR